MTYRDGLSGDDLQLAALACERLVTQRQYEHLVHAGTLDGVENMLTIAAKLAAEAKNRKAEEVLSKLDGDA